VRRGLRKPHYAYSLTPEAEQLFPKAYGALLGELLTVLEQREVVPVGAEKAEPIDVRLVCATNISRERLAERAKAL